MRFASPFDARLYAQGPHAIFTLDPRGDLRVDPERTREIHLLVDVPEDAERDAGVWVLTDRATGLRMLLVATHACLAEAQPRADAVRFASYDEAVVALKG